MIRDGMQQQLAQGYEQYTRHAIILVVVRVVDGRVVVDSVGGYCSVAALIIMRRM